jgi:ferric-dicitrate binding protein FerR (iron transport regulator)
MYRDRLFRAPAPAVATVESVAGEVRASGLALSPGATVGRQERVEAKEGARASLRLPSGERVQVIGPASVELLELRAGAAAELWLHAGKLLVDGPAQAKRPSPLVYTHEGTIVAQAARWEIVAADGATTLRVGRGRLRVEGLHGALTAVGAGQRLELRRGEGLPPSVPEADPSAIAELSDQR